MDFWLINFDINPFSMCQKSRPTHSMHIFKHTFFLFPFQRLSPCTYGNLFWCNVTWVVLTSVLTCWRLWAGSTHHGQGNDGRQVLCRQPNLCLGLLRGGAAAWVLHLPGHPAAAQRLREALHLQVHLEHPLHPRL